MRVLFLLALVGFSSPLLASAGEGYKAGTIFGKESDKGLVPENDRFLKQGKSVSHLSNLNETSLSGKGAKAARGEEFLHMSEEAKLEAFYEHDIGPENDLLQASAELEANPLLQTGGKYGTKQKTVTVETKEFCQEGVEFEVDVLRQLVYEPEIKTNIRKEEIKTPKKSVTKFDFVGSLPSKLRSALGGNNYGPGQIITVLKPSNQMWGWMGINGGGWSKGGTRSGLDKGGYKGVEEFVSVSGTWQCDDGRYAGLGKVADHWRTRHRFDLKVWAHRVETYKTYYDAGGPEYWITINPESQALVEANVCHQIDYEVLDSGTKTFDHGIKVKRDVWKEKRTFLCQTEPLNGCKYLKKKGCKLQKSKCINTSIKPCGKWKRKYLCKTERELLSPSISGSNIFCLDGKCHKPKIAQNNGLNEAAAYLAVFQQIQKDMDHKKPPTFFNGQANSCAIHLTNFTNCCTSMSGWGTSIGLSSCSSGEKALAKKKKKRLCHYVGTYCAEKLFGICLRKKSNYCCFGSKLARLFHQQGRAQIGRSFGSAKHPDCGPFTAEELALLDFSEMDFSEVFQDLFANLSEVAQKAIPKQLNNQMPKAQKKIQKQRGRNVHKAVF